MKKKGNAALILLILILLFLLTFGIERIFAVQIHKGNMISSSEELGVKITDYLEKGKDSFCTYVNGLKEEDLVGINHDLDGFFGHVSSYTVLRNVNADVMLVRFDLEVSDNYFVYRNIVEGEPIEDHPEAEQLAEKVLEVMEECDGNSDYEKVVRYHDYLVANTQYGFLSGEKEETSYTAAGALLYGTAVCNGYAEAMELLLLCSGIDSYMAVGTADEENHAWNIVSIDGEWYHVDATWDDPVPDMEDDTIHVYLNVNDEIMAKTHTWNKDAYPECTSMEYNYYEQEKKAFDSFNAFKAYILKEMRTSDRLEVMVKDSDDIQYDCGFVVQSGGADSVSWQSYEGGDYMVMVISIE